MANYYGAGRSNYFKLKEGKEDEFKTLLSNLGLSLIKNRELVGFVSDNEDGDIPDVFTNEQGEECEINFMLEELPKFLATGYVAIFQNVSIRDEVGNEKLRYVSGYAQAVNWKGKAEFLHLNDIELLAKGLAGKDIIVTNPYY